MDKWFHPTPYNAYNYLSILGLELIHISSRGPLYLATSRSSYAGAVCIFRGIYLFVYQSLKAVRSDNSLSNRWPGTYRSIKYCFFKPRLVSWPLYWALTDGGRLKEDAVLQTTFSNEFFRIRSFRMRFHWDMLSRIHVNHKPALLQIMAWRQMGKQPLSEQLMDWFIYAYMFHWGCNPEGYDLTNNNIVKTHVRKKAHSICVFLLFQSEFNLNAWRYQKVFPDNDNIIMDTNWKHFSIYLSVNRFKVYIRVLRK